VTTYFLLGGTRYAFRSRISKARCSVRLNAQQQVPGMGLFLPAELRVQQRRADFRLSLASHEVIAQGHPGSSENGGCCSIAAQRFNARLTNISAGGVGVLVNRSVTREWKPGQVFFLSFSLPEIKPTLCMMTDLRHMRVIHDGLYAVAGFKFLQWPPVPMKQYLREITQFIAAEQRRRLSKGR
jgi:c-di-GMP-binding flagellar brake protein YcgR